MLLRTSFGNWIFGVGGNLQAARNVGVPVGRVKILLFMGTAAAAWLVAMIQVDHPHRRRRAARHRPRVLRDHRGRHRRHAADRRLRIGHRRGLRRADLRHGRQGIVFAGVDADWFQVFLGAMLLIAVLVNRYIRTARGRPPMSAIRDAAGTPLLEVQNVSRYFGCVIALKDVSMTVYPGEVMCLLGDNGAGKSTLIKILSGVHQPSEGGYLVEGNEVHFTSPRDALAAGIATVYQDLAMIPLMSVSRNFFLGSEPKIGWGPFRRFDVKAADRVTREELPKMGIQIRNTDQAVGTLSGGERQSVAIARAVYFGAKVLILDEPTAALGVKEAGVVLRYIAQARARGLGVVFITHNVHHAYPIGDRFTLLNRGTLVRHVRQERDQPRGGRADDGRRRGAGRAGPRAGGVRPARCRAPAWVMTADTEAKLHEWDASSKPKVAR